MNQSKPPTVVMMLVVMFATITVVLMATLVFYEKDTDRFLNFVMVVVPSTIGLLFVGKRVDDIFDETRRQSRDIRVVKDQTNGMLNAKFNDVHSKLDEIKENGNNG